MEERVHRVKSEPLFVAPPVLSSLASNQLPRSLLLHSLPAKYYLAHTDAQTQTNTNAHDSGFWQCFL